MAKEEILNKAVETIRRELNRSNRVRFYFIESKKNLEQSEEIIIIGMYCLDNFEELYEQLQNSLFKLDLKVKKVRNKTVGLEVSC